MRWYAAIQARRLPAWAAAACLLGGLAPLPAHASMQPMDVCGKPAPGQVRCAAVVAAAVSSAPAGYSPADLAAAYRLPSSWAGGGQLIGIVDPFSDPTAESDLAVYRSEFGLPACASSSGCLTIVDQRGGTQLPPASEAWDLEISTDLQTASAACPLCRLLLVEADSADPGDVMASVAEAVHLGANEVSMSWTADEWAGQTAYDRVFQVPGVVFVAASGDWGSIAQYPASSPYVVAAGGTTLRREPTTRGWSEAVWESSASGEASGSGCSAFEPQPSWQHAVPAIAASGCSGRAVADVAADADPGTGVAIYDSQPGVLSSVGWMVVGGTSVSAPLIAGAAALAGGGAALGTGASRLYGLARQFYDITMGQTGPCGAQSQVFCQAGAGWDGPTGLGSPSSVDAFLSPVPPAEGAVFRAVDDGLLYRIVGGAPLRIYDGCRALGTACASPPTYGVAVLPLTPADGTLALAADTGFAYRLAGGAPLRLDACASTCATSSVQVQEETIDALGVDSMGVNHLLPFPVDSTQLAAGSARYRVAGGAPLRLYDCSGVCGPAFDQVDPDTIASLAPDALNHRHLLAHPEDGAFLLAFDTGAYYRVAGGHPFYLESCDQLAGCAGAVRVNQSTIVTDTNHLAPAAADGTLITGVTSGTQWQALTQQLAGASERCQLAQVATSAGVLLTDRAVAAYCAGIGALEGP